MQNKSTVSPSTSDIAPRLKRSAGKVAFGLTCSLVMTALTVLMWVLAAPHLPYLDSNTSWPVTGGCITATAVTVFMALNTAYHVGRHSFLRSVAAERGIPRRSLHAELQLASATI